MKHLNIFLMCGMLMAAALPGRGQSTVLPRHVVWQYAAALAGLGDDVFGRVRHPAMPVQGSMTSVGMVGESSAGRPGASIFSAVLGGPLKTGSLGATIDHRALFGLNESRLAIGYAQPLSGSFRMGIRFGYYRLRIPGYGAMLSAPVEWGAVFRRERLSIGFSAYHPIALGRAGRTPGHPSVFRTTAGWRVSGQTGIGVDVVRETGHALSCRPMVWYRPVPALRLLGGFITDTGSAFLGIRWKASRPDVDVFLERHPLLGWTGAVGFQHDFRWRAEP